MTTAASHPVSPARKPAVETAPPGPVARLNGEVVYLYAFDVAYEMNRLPVRHLLGQSVAQFVVDASKRSPRQLFFYRPQMVRLPPLERLGPSGPVRLELTVKILPVGAISITVRIPFSVNSLSELVSFHDLRFNDGSFLYDEVRALAEDVQRELKPYLIRPHEKLGDEEAYTVFCINGPLRTSDGVDVPAEGWLHANRRDVAALLTEEGDPARLSDQEAEESTGKYFSYYERDLVVMDWDAAVIVDEPRYFDEVLYIMELANLQLAELEAYDRILDRAVDRSYRDLGGGSRFRGATNQSVQRELREIRVDLARLSDELSNITKFFGDWHLARIYKGLADRFHLADWHRTIDEKLKTLDDLYQILRADQTSRMMLILEFTIVLLFVIDLIVLFVGLWK
ncbi:MAG: hypothetical protein QOF78_2379 [Phycisphaerales bacterium]|jgi:hypothetical protein|nr:hypothetical protein [Phycisphaerales bacterium]